MLLSKCLFDLMVHAIWADRAVAMEEIGVARAAGLSHLAEADVTRAISLAPSDPVMRFHRALYYEYVERWGDALADLERAIELVSEAAAPLHFHRGMT